VALTRTERGPKLRRNVNEHESSAARMGSKDFSSTAELPPLVAFGDFRLDTARVEVTYKGRPLALRPKAYALLSYLVAHPGRTIGKRELMTILWPSVVVTDDSLVQCVADLRASLGPDGAHLVTTVPRHGYRFDGVLESPADAASAVTPPAAPRRRYGLVELGAMGLAALALVIGWALWPSPAVDADLAFRRERSLVVLPLVPRGSQSSQEFADAMTDDLIGDIARLPGTTVIARASAAAAAAQEQDLKHIGKLLDVAYVVTGTVAQEDQGVEVALQFASAATGVVLWSGQWRQADAEMATRRGDIQLRIARALDLQLTSAAHKAPVSTARSPAILSLARGDHLLRSATGDPAAVRKAREAYQEAIAIDPASARGWTGLALSYLSEIQSRWSKDPVGQAEFAAQAIHKALAIDPDYPVAHYALGHLRIVRGDPAGALSSYERVLAINPSDAWAHARMAAALLALGRFDEVAAPVERARRLSPLEINQVSFGRVIAGAAHFHKGEDDAAYQQFRAAALGNPNNHSAWALMAALDALHGRNDAAAQSLARLKALRPQATVSVFRNTNAGNGPALQAGNERYFAGLLKAGLPP
jgi:DNA-binding winged helix-turn-helix (wHTH) protein/TolB-like protein/Tfp pilus assembly protein PilF